MPKHSSGVSFQEWRKQAQMAADEQEVVYRVFTPTWVTKGLRIAIIVTITIMAIGFSLADIGSLYALIHNMPNEAQSAGVNVTTFMGWRELTLPFARVLLLMVLAIGGIVSIVRHGGDQWLIATALVIMLALAAITPLAATDMYRDSIFTMSCYSQLAGDNDMRDMVEADHGTRSVPSGSHRLIFTKHPNGTVSVVSVGAGQEPSGADAARICQAVIDHAKSSR